VPAVPPIAREARTIKRIATELERAADILRNYPAGGYGEGVTRTPEPAKAIVRSLQRVNALLAAGSKVRSLKPAGFRTIGREFGKIGSTLVAVGSASKRKAKKPTRKKTARKTTRR